MDCVLLIGEHGDYEINEIGQKLYPRYRLFNGITEVFKEDGLSVPVFNDKHLSWNFEWAADMVAQGRLRFPNACRKFFACDLENAGCGITSGSRD